MRKRGRSTAVEGNAQCAVSVCSVRSSRRPRCSHLWHLWQLWHLWCLWYSARASSALRKCSCLRIQVRRRRVRRTFCSKGTMFHVKQRRFCAKWGSIHLAKPAFRGFLLMQRGMKDILPCPLPSFPKSFVTLPHTLSRLSPFVCRFYYRAFLPALSVRSDGRKHKEKRAHYRAPCASAHLPPRLSRVFPPLAGFVTLSPSLTRRIFSPRTSPSLTRRIFRRTPRRVTIPFAAPSVVPRVHRAFGRSFGRFLLVLEYARTHFLFLPFLFCQKCAKAAQAHSFCRFSAFCSSPTAPYRALAPPSACFAPCPSALYPCLRPCAPSFGACPPRARICLQMFHVEHS